MRKIFRAPGIERLFELLFASAYCQAKRASRESPPGRPNNKSPIYTLLNIIVCAINRGENNFPENEIN